MSSVLGAVSVVTFTSYNFSTGEKRHGSLFRSFIERYMKISFGGVFFVFSFQLSDNSHQVFRNLRAGERTLDGEIFFQNFLDRTAADFYQIFYGFHLYILFLLIFRIQFQSHSFATQHWSVGFPVMWSVFPLQSSLLCQLIFPLRFKIRDMF